MSRNVIDDVLLNKYRKSTATPQYFGSPSFVFDLSDIQRVFPDYVIGVGSEQHVISTASTVQVNSFVILFHGNLEWICTNSTISDVHSIDSKSNVALEDLIFFINEAFN